MVRAVSGLLGDYHRPLNVAELLQLFCVSGSGSMPPGMWCVWKAGLLLGVTGTGWRGLRRPDPTEQAQAEGALSLWL